MSEMPPVPGWKRSSLLSLADYHNGAAFNPSDWGEEGLPIIRIEQINDPSAPTDFYRGPLTPQNFVTTGDIIFSWSATLKAVIWRNGDGALNQHLFKVVPKNGTDKTFLKYVLEQNMEHISSGSQGSTMKHITRGELQRYQVEVPTQEAEQRRIAEILSTLDEAIEQTEALIAKYQQIKAGLMHDLFTRGVTPDGHLRPTRAQAPDLYKESPLGWLPKEWEVGELRHWLSYLSYGFTNPMPEADEGPYMVTAADINAGRIQYDTCRRTTRDAFDRLLTQKSRPKVCDVLLTKDGTLGRIAVVDRPDVCINQSVAVLRPADTRHSQFIAAMLSAPMWQQRMLSDAGGSTIKHIYITVVDKMLVAWPSRSEEPEAISARIGDSTGMIESEKDNLIKLRQQKHGLMHDLLTGRVRVRVAEWGGGADASGGSDGAG